MFHPVVLSICFCSCLYETCIVLRRHGRYCSVKTLPKMIAEARYVSRNNSLFCLTLSPLTLPKKSAFGKVSCMEKHLLLPQMTASLYLGLDVQKPGGSGPCPGVTLGPCCGGRRLYAPSGGALASERRVPLEGLRGVRGLRTGGDRPSGCGHREALLVARRVKPLLLKSRNSYVPGASVLGMVKGTLPLTAPGVAPG